MKKSLILLSIFCSSCATILDGSRTRIKVSGTPNNAKVFFNGAYQGTTPETFAVQKSAVKAGNAKITIQKDGFEQTEITLNHKTRIGFVVLDVLFGVVPLIFDVATGNLIAVRPANIEYNLQKKDFKEKETNQYSKMLIGKKVKFSLNNKNYEGIVIETFENKEANIKYTDEMGKITNAWKRFNEFQE